MPAVKESYGVREPDPALTGGAKGRLKRGAAFAPSPGRKAGDLNVMTRYGRITVGQRGGRSHFWKSGRCDNGMFMNVSVVIPAFNEEQGVAGVIRELRGVLLRHGIESEILVVDDG